MKTRLNNRRKRDAEWVKKSTSLVCISSMTKKEPSKLDFHPISCNISVHADGAPTKQTSPYCLCLPTTRKSSTSGRLLCSLKVPAYSFASNIEKRHGMNEKNVRGSRIIAISSARWRNMPISRTWRSLWDANHYLYKKKSLSCFGASFRYNLTSSLMRNLNTAL